MSIRTPSTCAAASWNGCPRGARAAGAPRTRSPSRIRIFGKRSPRRRRATTSHGIGSKATRDIRRTSAPTSSRTKASIRCSRAAKIRAPFVRREKPQPLMRQIVLDTETTGLEPGAGHRIIEIGCVELVNRKPTSNRFHRYVNPEREVDRGALEVHGIENDFLATQPKFAEVATELVEFISGAELVIHNADFDIEFLNHELRRLPGMPQEIRERCGVLDTLALARRMHPGQRNSLDALAKRYSVDNSKRELHGALLDAQILAECYLAMTGGQVSLSLEAEPARAAAAHPIELRLDRRGLVLPVLKATAEEERAHEAMLAVMAKKGGQLPLWREL